MRQLIFFLTTLFPVSTPRETWPFKYARGTLAISSKVVAHTGRPETVAWISPRPIIGRGHTPGGSSHKWMLGGTYIQSKPKHGQSLDDIDLENICYFDRGALGTAVFFRLLIRALIQIFTDIRYPTRLTIMPIIHQISSFYFDLRIQYAPTNALIHHHLRRPGFV